MNDKQKLTAWKYATKIAVVGGILATINTFLYTLQRSFKIAYNQKRVVSAVIQDPNDNQLEKLVLKTKDGKEQILVKSIDKKYHSKN